MLRPSRPMMRPFISSLGSWTDGHGHLCRVVNHHALDGGDDDVACLVLGLFLGLALDGACEANRVVLGVDAHLLEEDLLRLVLRHLGDSLERGDLLGTSAGELFLGLIELSFAGDQLAVALLEHVGALVQLLVALEQALLEAGKLGASRSGVIFGFASESDLLVLGLEDQLFLLSAGLGDDARRLVLRCTDRLRRQHRARHEPDSETGSDGQHNHHRQNDGIIHIYLPPIQPLTGRMCAGLLGCGPALSRRYRGPDRLAGQRDNLRKSPIPAAGWATLPLVRNRPCFVWPEAYAGLEILVKRFASAFRVQFPQPTRTSTEPWRTTRSSWVRRQPC